jgi:hypothetical protein
MTLTYRLKEHEVFFTQEQLPMMQKIHGKNKIKLCIKLKKPVTIKSIKHKRKILTIRSHCYPKQAPTALKHLVNTYDNVSEQ